MKVRFLIGVLVGLAVLELLGDPPTEAYFLALVIAAMVMQAPAESMEADEPPAIAMDEDL